MATLGQRMSFSASLSVASEAAKPCARLVQDNPARTDPCRRAASMRSRYSARPGALRSRIRSVTARTWRWTSDELVVMSHCATSARPTRTRLQVLRSHPYVNEDVPTVAVLSTFDMLLFGGTGDLVTRKLLPALYRRYAAGQVSAESRIYGVARTALSRTEYLTQAESACREFLGKEFNAPHWTAFSGLLGYVKLDATAEADYAALKPLLRGRDAIIRVF